MLYARQRLGLSDVGFGFLLTTFAVGGLLGTVLAPRLLRIVGACTLLRAGLLVEGITHTTLAITTTPLVAATILIVFLGYTPWSGASSW